MVGMNPDEGRYVVACVLITLITQTVISYTYLTSLLFGNVQLAQAVTPVILIPLMLFGGFFLNTS